MSILLEYCSVKKKKKKVSYSCKLTHKLTGSKRHY